MEPPSSKTVSAYHAALISTKHAAFCLHSSRWNELRLLRRVQHFIGVFWQDNSIHGSLETPSHLFKLHSVPDSHIQFMSPRLFQWESIVTGEGMAAATACWQTGVECWLARISPQTPATTISTAKTLTSKSTASNVDSQTQLQQEVGFCQRVQVLGLTDEQIPPSKVEHTRHFDYESATPLGQS